MSEPVDLLVKGRVVDVNTGTLEDRTIAVDDGEIVSFGERPASRVLEAAYVTPGLIDAHTHTSRRRWSRSHSTATQSCHME